MERGQRWWNEPPWWAWVVIVVGLAFLIVGTPIAIDRGKVEATAAAPPVATSSAAPETVPPEAVSPVTVTRPADGPLRVLFTGDSLTGGLSATSEDTAFKWLMLDALEGGGPVEEFNSAISGGTAVEVSDSFEVPEGLHLAVVELGTNDLAKATPLPDFEDAYVSLLDRITAGSPDVGLVCAGVWEAAPGPSAPQYNAVIQSACEAHGGQFQSLTPIYSAGNAIGPPGEPALGGETDDFHPNDTGHRAIAGALLARISVSG